MKPVGFELREQRRKVRDIEGATGLRGIAAVFCESDLDVSRASTAELYGVSLRETTRNPNTVS